MRVTNQRTALWAQDKASFDYPFMHFVKNPVARCLGGFSVRPLLTQTDEQAIALAGDFPHDIASWIWSVPGANDSEDWMGLFLLNTGAYGFYKAGCSYTGFTAYGNQELIVGSLAEVINHGMSDRAYELYMEKTAPALLCQLLPNLVKPVQDPKPHGY